MASHTPGVDMSETSMPMETDMFESSVPSFTPVFSESFQTVTESPDTFESSDEPVPPPSTAVPSGSTAPPVGESASPSSEGDAEGQGDGVCVDASLLSGIAQKDRVFSSDRRASVLCDDSGTCATSGHMVVWKGEPMAMQRYCSIIGSKCTTQVRWVNSPRYSRGLRLTSRTDDLLLTPLAAKWNTRGEHLVLGLAVRVGL